MKKRGAMMQKLSKILAVIDPTVKEQPGMHRAAWLAKQTGGDLELLVCYYNEYLSGDRLFDSPSLEKAREGSNRQSRQSTSKNSPSLCGRPASSYRRLLSGTTHCTRVSCDTPYRVARNLIVQGHASPLSRTRGPC